MTTTPVRNGQTTSYPIGSLPRHPTSASSRHRSSIGSTFSFGPQQLAGDSYLDANDSGFSPQSATFETNRSFFASPLRSTHGLRRKGSQHPLATDTTDVFQESEDDGDSQEEEEEWGTVDRMRLWRHDAMMQHQYDTAAFWGDKLVTWTNDANDIFWLAQIYHNNHQYARAERLLSRPYSIVQSNQTISVHSAISKGKGREPHMPIARLPMGHAGMIQVPERLQDTVSRLVDLSVSCRYLAAQCLVQDGRLTEAAEMLGESNPFGRTDQDVDLDGGLKVEASMCLLRGNLMLKLNRAEQAKRCYMEALSLDVKCFGAFDQLTKCEMMTPKEEWEFVNGLSFTTQAPEDSEFVRLMYISRMSKYDEHVQEHAVARQRLVEEFGLADNPDVLYTFADALYAACRWSDCLAMTTRILGLVAGHSRALPLHIACMYHLGNSHSKLFLLAHEMVDREPESAISWYAVGVWYLTCSKWGDARSYFSKASLIDPRFPPAWIGFAHSFAYEGEHDNAVTAYSTSARIFAGSHHALMFVGMEHMTISNYPAAREALNAAYSMCSGDPLLANERGVMAYNEGKYDEAVMLFEEALRLAKITQFPSNAWTSTLLNLGTCYRKLKKYRKAEDTYTQALNIEPQNPLALAFLAMVYQMTSRFGEAIQKYHESLSLQPSNSYVNEMLLLALETNAATNEKMSLEDYTESGPALQKFYQKLSRFGVSGIAQSASGPRLESSGEYSADISMS